MSMIPPAALVAAYAQAILAVTITWTLLLVVWCKGPPPGPAPMADASAYATAWMDAHAIVLRYLYLLAAIGLLPAGKAHFDAAAERIRQRSASLNPLAPKREAETTFHQLLFAAICFAIATLQPPPPLLAAALGGFAPLWLASALWSGALSTATAAFAATALAARGAL